MRFSEDHDAILKKLAAVYDVTDVTVVRWAVKALGVYHARTGQLPPMEITEAPLILHEPPVSTLRPELVRPEDSGRKNKPAQKATARD